MICSGMQGMFALAPQTIECMCGECRNKSVSQRTFSPTQFEAHCGAGAAKKWKASVRVLQGAPGVPPGASSCTAPRFSQTDRCACFIHEWIGCFGCVTCFSTCIKWNGGLRCLHSDLLLNLRLCIDHGRSASR